jgi:hypothetical protein
MTPAVEIDKVEVYPADPERVQCFLESPRTGDETDLYAIDIRGWVFGCKAPLAAVEVVSEGILLRRVAADVVRPDIAARFPGSEKCGFRVALSVFALPLPFEFEVRVQAVFQDDSYAPIALIRGRRSSLCPPNPPGLRPLMVTTLGRTGSSWLTLLLGRHPEIVAYRPFQYEPRAATYWLEIFRALSEPVSTVQMIRPDLSGRRWWLGKEDTSVHPGGRCLVWDPGVDQWLARTHVEELRDFCLGRIEGLYRQVAAAHNQTNAVYFSEKYSVNPFVTTLMWELYPQAREIFLVRDFRDVLCSISAFRKKYPGATFYSDKANIYKELVEQLQMEARDLLAAWQRRSDKAHLLRYEDLIQRPEETLERALAYLDLRRNPETIREMMRQAQALKAAEQRAHQTSQGPEASIGRWRHDLDSNTQALCREVLGDALRGFGYDDIPGGS